MTKSRKETELASKKIKERESDGLGCLQELNWGEKKKGVRPPGIIFVLHPGS